MIRKILINLSTAVFILGVMAIFYLRSVNIGEQLQVLAPVVLIVAAFLMLLIGKLMRRKPKEKK